MSSFQADLERRAGGSLQELNPTNERVRAWNQGIDQGHARAFDDRVLLGLGIDEAKPAYGDIRTYQKEVGERLGRTDRWVRETVQVATSIRTAFEFGLELPSELRTVPWRLVPKAIENVRAGRALDYSPSKESRPVTLRQIGTLVKQLTKQIEKLENPEDQEKAIRLAIDALESIGEPEPPTLGPGEIVETPDEPRRRPGRRRGRGRRTPPSK